MMRFDRTTRIIFIFLLIVLCLLCWVFWEGASRTGLVAGGLSSPGMTPSITLTPTNTLLPSLTPTLTPTPRPAFRALADQHGLLVGAAVAPFWLQDPEYAGLLTQEFSAIVPENAMKFEVIHPEPDRFDFSQADAITDFAVIHGLKVRGHPLVWGNQLPAWLVQGEFTREQWIEILREHIDTVVSHFQDESGVSSVFAWDVINEAVGLEGELYQNFWLEKIGPEYIPLAFQFAHEADPQALLFYNDNGGEGLDAKSNGIYNLVKELIQQGVPIHGVGMQLHTGPGWPPTQDELAANLQRLAELGLQVHITEMDVRIQDTPGDRDQQLAAQAERYQQVMAACLQVPNCTAFLTWGLTDRYSWIPGHTGNPDAPLLFDENFQPKPALFTLLELLQDR